MSAFQTKITEQEKAIYLRYLAQVPTTNSRDITELMARENVFSVRWLTNRVYAVDPYSVMAPDERATAVATAIRILTEMQVMRVLSVDESRTRFNHRRADHGALYQIISLDPLLPKQVHAMAHPDAYVPEKALKGTPVEHWRPIKGMDGWEAGYTDTMQPIDGAVRPVSNASAAA